ncbi:MAG: hypothetical protein KAG96_02835 [Ichthyobacteriaceae bacterium]|nr:hypothetical protein [Ichthyobacteriaceae bacterium]
MKIRNESVKKLFIGYYLIAVILLLIRFLESTFNGKYFVYELSNYLLVVYFIVAVLVFAFRGLPCFFYDAEGEALVFNASEPVLVTPILGFNKIVEFPKSKLHDFKVDKLFLRNNLLLYLDGSNGEIKRIKIPISYLRKKQITLLKQSLNEVLVKNNPQN